MPKYLKTPKAYYKDDKLKSKKAQKYEIRLCLIYKLYDKFIYTLLCDESVMMS